MKIVGLIQILKPSVDQWIVDETCRQSIQHLSSKLFEVFLIFYDTEQSTYRSGLSAPLP